MDQHIPNTQVNKDVQKNSTHSRISVKHHLVFSLLSLLFLVAAVIAVYFWQNTKVNKLKQQVSVLNLQVSKLEKEDTTSTKNPLTAASVSNLIGGFYKQYFMEEDSHTGSSQSNDIYKLISQYGTSNLLSYVNPTSGGYAANPITCSQDFPYLDSVNVSNIDLGMDSAMATVTEYFSNSNDDINATVVNQSGVLKIDKITCNPPLTVITETSPSP
jgi:outer membrane murein-binding lipoprotein Lpp